MRNRYAVLAMAAASSFITIVDFTIVNVALPRMAADLKLGEDSLQWVIIGYGLPFGGLLLLAGRIGDVLGRRLVLQIGLGIFAVASLTAGLSDSSAQLIGARVVQGIGAAMITPSALGVVADAFKEGRDRDNALGIYGAVAGTAASVGVFAGGFLTDGPGWSWIFYVNVPIAIALCVASVLVLPENRIAHPGGRLDPRSALSITGGLVMGLYALNHGVVHGWSTAGTLTSAGAAAVLLGAFFASERRTPSPFVPRSLIRNGPVVRANLAAAAGFGSWLAFVFLTSVVMQQLLGYSPTKTGLAWLFTTVTGFFFAGVTGAVLAQKVGQRILLGLASVLVVAAASWLTFLPVHTSFGGRVIPALIAAGIAVGLLAPSVQIGALTNVVDTDFGAASGLIETSRELGGAIVIAGASTALLGSHSGFLHGVHAAYTVIAIAAALGVLASVVRITPNNAQRAHVDLGSEPTLQQAGR